MEGTGEIYKSAKVQFGAIRCNNALVQRCKGAYVYKCTIALHKIALKKAIW
jgi:hypothetical protein